MGKETDADKTSEKQRKVASDYKKTTGGTYNMNQAPVPGIQPANKNYARNLDLAKNLEAKAKGYDPFGTKGGFPSLVTQGLTEIGKFSMRHQANKLKSGGMPVFDKNNKLQGVVSENMFGALVYSGNAAYSPIGRSKTGFNNETGSYTTDALSQNNDDGGDNVTSAAPVQQEKKTAGTIASATSGTQLAQKNTALEATVGGVDRRNFLSRGRRGGLGG